MARLGPGLLIVSAILFGSTSSTPAASRTTERSRADEPAFQEEVRPFLDRYCARCHNGTRSEGNVNLVEISPLLAEGQDIELWKTVLLQLVVEAMPPSDGKQPRFKLPPKTCRVLSGPPQER